MVNSDNKSNSKKKQYPMFKFQMIMSDIDQSLSLRVSTEPSQQVCGIFSGTVMRHFMNGNRQVFDLAVQWNKCSWIPQDTKGLYDSG